LKVESPSHSKNIESGRPLRPQQPQEGQKGLRARRQMLASHPSKSTPNLTQRPCSESSTSSFPLPNSWPQRTTTRGRAPPLAQDQVGAARAGISPCHANLPSDTSLVLAVCCLPAGGTRNHNSVGSRWYTPLAKRPRITLQNTPTPEAGRRENQQAAGPIRARPPPEGQLWAVLPPILPLPAGVFQGPLPACPAILRQGL
jgi:hypothetical protein